MAEEIVYDRAGYPDYACLKRRFQMNENIETLQRNIEYIEGRFFKDDGTAADDELGMSLEAMKKALAKLKPESQEPTKQSTCKGTGNLMCWIELPSGPMRGLAPCPGCPDCQSQEKLPGFDDIIGLYADDEPESKEPTKVCPHGTPENEPCQQCCDLYEESLGPKPKCQSQEKGNNMLNGYDGDVISEQEEIGMLEQNDEPESHEPAATITILKDCTSCEYFHHNKKDEHCYRYTQQPDNCQQIKSQELAKPSDFMKRVQKAYNLLQYGGESVAGKLLFEACEIIEAAGKKLKKRPWQNMREEIETLKRECNKWKQNAEAGEAQYQLESDANQTLIQAKENMANENEKLRREMEAKFEAETKARQEAKEEIKILTGKMKTERNYGTEQTRKNIKLQEQLKTAKGSHKCKGCDEIIYYQSYCKKCNRQWES